jgi:hypothetical protein
MVVGRGLNEAFLIIPSGCWGNCRRDSDHDTYVMLQQMQKKQKPAAAATSTATAAYMDSSSFCVHAIVAMALGVGF